MSQPTKVALSTARRIRVWSTLSLLVAVPVAGFALSAINFLDAAEIAALADRQEQAVALLEKRKGAAGDLKAPVPDSSAIYLKGRTPTLARAELQRFLVDAAERSGARVIEAQDDEADEQLNLVREDRVRLRLTFDARNVALIAFLHAVETGLPLLTVEKIVIHRLDAGANGDPDDPSLRIDVLVAGAGRFVTG